MIIINSGAYVVPEFRTEFGKIPPCLVPLGNKKLIEFQVPALRRTFHEDIYVSLPENYQLCVDELQLLAELKVQVVYVPDGLSLAEALLYLINVIDAPDTNIRLLHGDTYIEDIPEGDDAVAVSESQDDYAWETESTNAANELVWSGYFSFQSKRLFTKCLALSQGNFVRAVRRYMADVSVELRHIDKWHDLGHVNTYYASRSRITTQRVFNSLRINDGLVFKSGTHTDKIQAETAWFQNIPAHIRRYTPQLIDHGISPESGQPFYVLEYLPCTPLNEVYVHGRNPAFFWKRILGLMENFLDRARLKSESIDMAQLSQDAEFLYNTKTLERLELYREQNPSLNLDNPNYYDNERLPSLREIVDDCIARVQKTPVIAAIQHGDFCLSNILFDSRATDIKVIDPRGIAGSGRPTIYGDQRYDLAKLAHSIVGLYDYIIAGRYQILNSGTPACTIEFPFDARIKEIQDQFMNTSWIPDVKTEDIIPLVVLLFMSMLPLHSDTPKRQQAMLINGLRIYAMIRV